MGKLSIWNHSKTYIAIILIIMIVFFLEYSGFLSRIVGSQENSELERNKKYSNMLAQVDKSVTWPKTEQDLIKAFWEAIAQKNLEQATIYCPGSVESDYNGYTRLNPSPKIHIIQSQIHPESKEVSVWTCQVNFSYIEKKTLKFAIAKSPSGRLIIDGKKTIWW